MNCREAHEYLFAFLDNELDAYLSIEMQRHLEQCTRCAREAEIERTIRRQLAEALQNTATSVRALDEADLQTTIGHVTAPVTHKAIHGRPQYSRRALLATGLAAVIVFALLVIRTVHRQRPASNQFVDLLVADFEHFQEKGRPLQIVSSDPLEVSDWLADQSALLVKLPIVPDVQGKLLGARKCKVHGQPAAFAVYELGGAIASLVVLPGTHPDIDDMQRVEHDGHTHWVDRCKGHTVVACRRGPLVYAAVSTLPEDRLLPLMASAEH